jgi:hypothetical protein
MFTYAEAETLLARAFGVSEDVQKAAFRGRLKHLKKLGVPLDSAPGKGKKILYSKDHVFQWAYCLELSEFGIDPTLVADILHRTWEMTMRIGYEAAEMATDRRFYGFIQRDIMTSAWDPAKRATRVGTFEEKNAVEMIRRLEVSPHRLCVFEMDHVVRLVASFDEAKAKSS